MTADTPESVGEILIASEPKWTPITNILTSYASVSKADLAEVDKILDGKELSEPDPADLQARQEFEHLHPALAALLKTTLKKVTQLKKDAKSFACIGDNQLVDVGQQKSI